MKTSLTLLLTIISVFGYSQNFSSQDPAYIENVTKGEEALGAAEYDSCVYYYTKGFEIKQTSYLSLLRGAACAYSIDDMGLSQQWMDKAMENSWQGTKQIFEGYEEFDLFRDTPFDSMVLSKYDIAAKASGLDLELMAEFDSIRVYDQKWRRLMRDTSEAYGWDSPQMKELWSHQSYHDSLNTQRIEEVIVEVGGYPGRSVVGDQHASTAFLVIQHAPLEVQEKYVEMFKSAADAGEVLWGSIALLIDRVNLGQGKKQIYGSQVGRDENSGERYLLPIEHPYKIDSLRSSVGLGPINDYTKIWNFSFDIEKHKEIWKKLEEAEKKE